MELSFQYVAFDYKGCNIIIVNISFFCKIVSNIDGPV